MSQKVCCDGSNRRFAVSEYIKMLSHSHRQSVLGLTHILFSTLSTENEIHTVLCVWCECLLNFKDCVIDRIVYET